METKEEEKWETIQISSYLFNFGLVVRYTSQEIGGLNRN